MNELIQIITDEQGPKVRSARELHEFLEVKSKFADWFKNRIKKYGFVEGHDFVTVSKNLETGGRELDYGLTLDMAKELSMVERNEKGKQARQYFIDAEKALRQVIDPALSASPTTEQVLIQLVSQQNQLMAGTQELLSQLRSDVDSIMAGTRKPIGSGAITRRAMGPGSGRQLGLPGMPPPSAPSLRLLVNRKIDEYCDRSGYDRRDTWNYLYKRLFMVYGIDPHRLQRIGSESILDAIERYGHLDRLYALIMAELTYSED